MSVQGAMIPREKILWARPEVSLGLLEAAGGRGCETNAGSERRRKMMGAHHRDDYASISILRVMQARSDVGPRITPDAISNNFRC